MEYTIKDVCRISGQSARTIRFYDKIGLLTPEKIRSNGYRIYTERQLDILQQILFYRELDMQTGLFLRRFSSMQIHNRRLQLQLLLRLFRLQLLRLSDNRLPKHYLPPYRLQRM